MTKADKINALIALLIMVILAVGGHNLQGNNLAFTLGFPLVMYSLFFWLSRAQTARWLEKNDQNEVVSRRPMTQRVFFGFLAGPLAWLTYKAGLSLLPSVSDPATRTAELSTLLLLVSVPVCLLFGAGPRRLRLDVRRQHYSFQQGIPFLTWTKQGQTSGGEFSISRSKSGYYHILFRAANWKLGLPIASFETEEEVRSQAWEIADKLALSVKRRGAS